MTRHQTKPQRRNQWKTIVSSLCSLNSHISARAFYGTAIFSQSVGSAELSPGYPNLQTAFQVVAARPPCLDRFPMYAQADTGHPFSSNYLGYETETDAPPSI